MALTAEGKKPPDGKDEATATIDEEAGRSAGVYYSVPGKRASPAH
jgi:hypothetical protein